MSDAEEEAELERYIRGMKIRVNWKVFDNSIAKRVSEFLLSHSQQQAEAVERGRCKDPVERVWLQEHTLKVLGDTEAEIEFVFQSENVRERQKVDIFIPVQGARISDRSLSFAVKETGAELGVISTQQWNELIEAAWEDEDLIEVESNAG